MCGPIPKTLWVVLVNLANDRPGRPRFVSWRRRAQNIEDLFLPLVPVGDVGFDVVRTILNDGSVARIKLCVLRLPFCESPVVIVHFLEAGHVSPKIFEDCGSKAEDGVCGEEGFIEWGVDSYGVGGVTGGEDEVDGSEIGICGVSLVGGDWQLEVVCEVMPGGTRRGLGIVFHRNGFDIIVQGQILGLEWELPKPGRFERFCGGGIPFGPPLSDESKDSSDPLVMIEMPMGDDDL